MWYWAYPELELYEIWILSEADWVTLSLVHRTAGGRGGLLCSRQESVRGWLVRAVVEEGESMNVENIPVTRIKCIIVNVEITYVEMIR